MTVEMHEWNESLYADLLAGRCTCAEYEAGCYHEEANQCQPR